MPLVKMLHRWIDDVEVKRCYVCGQWLPLAMFCRRARAWDSLRADCKVCSYRNLRRWRKANRDRLAENQRQRYAENPDKYREDARRWGRANPESVKAKNHRWRARKALAEGASYTTIDHIEARYEVWGRRCYLCGALAEAIDHVVPLAEGGSHWPANLRPVCTRCNSKKGPAWPYDIEQHRREAGYYVP